VSGRQLAPTLATREAPRRLNSVRPRGARADCVRPGPAPLKLVQITFQPEVVYSRLRRLLCGKANRLTVAIGPFALVSANGVCVATHGRTL